MGPRAGTVTFQELSDGRTEVVLAMRQSLPSMLVELKVGVFGIQTSLRPILNENMEAFRQLVEAAARDPTSMPPRQEAGPRQYKMFDEDNDDAVRAGACSPIWQPCRESVIGICAPCAALVCGP